MCLQTPTPQTHLDEAICSPTEYHSYILPTIPFPSPSRATQTSTCTPCLVLFQRTRAPSSPFLRATRRRSFFTGIPRTFRRRSIITFERLAFGAGLCQHFAAKFCSPGCTRVLFFDTTLFGTLACRCCRILSFRRPCLGAVARSFDQISWVLPARVVCCEHRLFDVPGRPFVSWICFRELLSLMFHLLH